MEVRMLATLLMVGTCLWFGCSKKEPQPTAAVTPPPQTPAESTAEPVRAKSADADPFGAQAKPAGADPFGARAKSTGADPFGDQAKPVSAKPEPPKPVNRTWTRTDGKTVQATFVKSEDGKVTIITASGKTGAVPMELLSEADREYVKQMTDPQP